jgi:hypothetical protein
MTNRIQEFCSVAVSDSHSKFYIQRAMCKTRRICGSSPARSCSGGCATEMLGVTPGPSKTRGRLLSGSAFKAGLGDEMVVSSFFRTFVEA